ASSPPAKAAGGFLGSTTSPTTSGNESGSNNENSSSSSSASGSAQLQQQGQQQPPKRSPLWHFLKILVIISFLCGYVASYASELLASSHQVPSLVAEGIVPRWTGLGYKHPSLETPWGGIAFHTLMVGLLIFFFDFHQLQIFESMFSVLT
ncbi:unnamed protein product, partial [Amoebophrya sp. A25]